MVLPVAIDAMGGDHAPGEPVAAAAAAAEQGIDCILVGDTGALDAAGGGRALRIVHAPEAVAMHEDSAIGLRTKPGASIRVAMELAARGEAAAVVSAGPTGATLAAALLVLGRAAGVRRPAVAAVLPAAAGPGIVLVDAGANPDPPAEVVAAFAPMGVAYAEALGVTAPRIGLLNTGAEAGKGNALARAVHERLTDRPDFAGNVEPAAVVAGAVDVVVADGFSGNLFLKTYEAVGRGTEDAHAGAAVLLGIAGTVLVAHGAADQHVIGRALATARDVAASGLTERIGERLGAARAGEVADG